MRCSREGAPPPPALPCMLQSVQPEGTKPQRQAKGKAIICGLQASPTHGSTRTALSS